MPEPLETCQEPLCQILTLGDALGLELRSFLGLMLAFIFRILDILKYMKVYEGIWAYLTLYESI